MLAAVCLAVAAVFLLPEQAWAWGPATHVYLGSALLDSLHLVPEAVRTIVAAHPFDFLYGNLAADISLAKKYVPEGRHCHHWHIGEEIHAKAPNDRLKSMSLGYLCHLAADTIAHNYFVPRQLVLTSSTSGVGHSYWEARMDTHLDERYRRLARHVVMEHDHSEADALFDQVLSHTLFTFRTNRRIFRGMIRFQDSERWQSVFGTMVARSRWDLSDEAVVGYLERSFDYVVDYLARRGEAICAGLDPIGDRHLAMSKQVRRMALQDGAAQNPALLHEMADNFFPLPEIPFGHLRALPEGSRHHLPVSVG
ncbi:MAG TPA: zinc dependent phospholipase C family protein [Longimicrobium sp.]